MLDNEPTDTESTDKVASTTSSQGGEATGGEPAETATPRRARTTRRRTTSAASSAQPDEPTGADQAAAPDQTAEGEQAAPVRRRRRTAISGSTGEVGESSQEATDAPQPEEAAPERVTRTRRRKATSAAAPAAVDTSAGAVTAAEGAEGPISGAVASGSGDSGSGSGQSGASGAGAAQPAARDAGEPAQEAPQEVEGEREGRRRRRATTAVLFMAPEAEVPPAVRSTEAGRSGPARSTEPRSTEPRATEPRATEPRTTESRSVEPTRPADEPVAARSADPAGETSRRRRRGRRTPDGEIAAEPAGGAAAASTGGSRRDWADHDAAEAETDELESDQDLADDDDGDDSAAARRRRRRGRRGRGRGKGTHDEADEDADADAEAEAEADGEDDEEDEADGGEPLTRRRRRRRRKGAGDADSPADDGVPTVVKIREPRRVSDEVQGVSGSTRLEAKRQRRRDGREQRRTRPPILTEAEFLARREAVDRVMAVRQMTDRTQIAVLEDGVLVEHYVSRLTSGTMAGNVYLGKVQNVLPSMEAAFVDIGRGRNAVLYAGEVNWDATGLEGRARSIEQALRAGDSVLVQVTKDPIGHKGARLTSHIALSGRHLVYVPNGNASGISRKLPDTERRRLRDILKKLVPEGAGVIVRTAAEGASEDELARDVKRLQAQWEDIAAKATEGGAPVLLYEEPDLVIRVVRDLFNEDFRELVVQGEVAYEMVESYLTHVSPDLVDRLHRYTGVGDVFAAKRIDEQILKGLDRKVFLPSGGHLVIDRTEAMTVVDVNTGKYTGAGGNLEETVTRNNLEAAEEIVRQLRLRDLGGIVVIDFIDMVLESNRDLVLRRLTECLGRDRTKHQVTEITSLGLVQMTRKRIGAGLLEAFSETCECCKGRGLIIHTEPVSEKAKGTNNVVDRVKAVASASVRTDSGAGAGTATGPGRRRGRRGGGGEAAGTGPDEPATVDDTLIDEEQGEQVGSDEDEGVLAADGVDVIEADEVEVIESDEDEEGEYAGPAAGGRRRSRRGGPRRRTRS